MKEGSISPKLWPLSSDPFVQRFLQKELHRKPNFPIFFPVGSYCSVLFFNSHTSYNFSICIYGLRIDICKPISDYISYIICRISKCIKIIVHLWNNGRTKALPGVQRLSSPPTSPRNKEIQRNARGQHLASNPHTALPYHTPSARLPTPHNLQPN